MCKARKTDRWKGKHSLLTGFGLFNDYFVVKSIDDISLYWIPDKVVVYASKTIIAIDNMRIYEFHIIKVTLATFDIYVWIIVVIVVFFIPLLFEAYKMIEC